MVTKSGGMRVHRRMARFLLYSGAVEWRACEGDVVHLSHFPLFLF